jgi:hypothetical protein
MQVQNLCEKTEPLLCAAAFTLGICTWVMLAGSRVTFAGIFVTLLFFLGVMAWASYSELHFPSEATNASFIPLGFSINSCISLALIFCRAGTTNSGILASALGVTLYLRAICDRPNRVISLQPSLPVHDKQNKSKSLHILAVGVFVATFLCYRQLASASTLGLTSINTIIEGWSDLILHSVTVLQLSCLDFTEAPLSAFNATSAIHPYHYGAYAFPSLLASSSDEISPLVAYISCTVPIGITLLLCPILDRSGIFKSSRSVSSNIYYFIGILLVYLLWCKILSQSFLDPLWLLITGPSVIYASALIVSFFNILSLGNDARHHNKHALLSIIVFTQICAFKFQVAHSLLLVFSYIILERLIFRKRAKRKVSRFAVFTLTVITLSGAQLALYRLLNSGRENYFQDLIGFASSIANMTSIATSELSAGDKPLFISLITPISGFLLLLGPLFATSVLVSLSRGDGMASRLEDRLIILTLLSYAFGILLNPVTPWDSGEFQNRSWPTLWCIGLWYLSFVSSSIPNYLSPRASRTVILLFIVLIMTLLPSRKIVFAGRPLFANDWTKSYYPLSISPSDKQLAFDLKQHAANPNSFIYIPNGSDALYNDQVSIIASLSGISPFFSRQKMQYALSKLGDSTRVGRWKDEISRINDEIINACATPTRSGGIVSVPKYSLSTRRNSVIVAPCNDWPANASVRN